MIRFWSEGDIQGKAISSRAEQVDTSFPRKLSSNLTGVTTQDRNENKGRCERIKPLAIIDKKT